MRSKMMFAALSAATLGTALPAAPVGAQGYPPQAAYQGQYDANGFWRDAPRDVWQRVGWLQQRIDRGAADGSLTRNEARRTQMELNGIRRDAAQLRGRRGYLNPSDSDRIQVRLDDLSRRIQWQRGNDRYARGDDRYAGNNADRYATNYDAVRDYRDDPRYTERTLSANDQVYRGSDGRYYCKRSDGTTGLIIGAAGGGILGNVIDGGHNRVAGTLIGGALGALLGKTVDQNNSQVRCR